MTEDVLSNVGPHLSELCVVVANYAVDANFLICSRRACIRVELDDGKTRCTYQWRERFGRGLI